MTSSNLDILIIGAGQAGLALGYHLRQTSWHFQLVDGHGRIGDSWRNRYASLRLFTPRSYSSLPGMELSGDPAGYAGRIEFADYLEVYARHFALPVVMNTTIQKLDRANDCFRASTESGQIITTRSVVLATGAFQQPIIPAFSKSFSAGTLQFSPATYRNPGEIPAGVVLVVGDGATGRDIAAELADSHRVLLAAGRSRRLVPDYILGRSAWWWFDKFGFLRVSPGTPLGRYLRRSDPFPGRGKGLKQLALKGVRVMSRLVNVMGRRVTFSDGESAEVDIVIWTTGYRDRSDWVDIPEVKDAQGQFLQQSGISSVAGLYFIGRPWQTNRGSALILGVGADAEDLARKITTHLQAASVIP
ncbi:MAG: NAD(P)/FAD-dependent oxidoreductase [Chloroflexota bacterium]|nr:potassium transporter [Chloroflexi bacterium CFX2]NOH00590.1 NAD(P)-binding domain-containing protein [Chloroflexota bacterium]WKZ36339.1 MAG: NAD(P)/FAD-dependent oxidoreductase [Anaerolineales bacterium]